MADATYPPMRRKDRAITDPAQLEQILDQCQVMRLAMIRPMSPEPRMTTRLPGR